MVGYVRAQGKRNGVAHVTIGRPLSLADALSQETDQRLAIQKAGIEVCHRINEVTPVTVSSLAMLAFLGIEDRALTVRELTAILTPLFGYITARNLPIAGDVELSDPRVIEKALQTHVDSGVLERFDRGGEQVFYLARTSILSLPSTATTRFTFLSCVPSPNSYFRQPSKSGSRTHRGRVGRGQAHPRFVEIRVLLQ